MGRFSGIGSKMMSADSKALARGYKAMPSVRSGLREGVEMLGRPGLRNTYSDAGKAYSRGRRRLIMGGGAAAAYTMVAPPNPNSRAGRSGSGRSSGATGMLNSRSIGGYA